MIDPRHNDYMDLLAALRLLDDQLSQIQFLLPKLVHSDNLFELQYYMLKEVIPFMKSLDGIMNKWLREENV